MTVCLHKHTLLPIQPTMDRKEQPTNALGPPRPHQHQCSTAQHLLLSLSILHSTVSPPSRSTLFCYGPTAHLPHGPSIDYSPNLTLVARPSSIALHPDPLPVPPSLALPIRAMAQPHHRPTPPFPSPYLFHISCTNVTRPIRADDEKCTLAIQLSMHCHVHTQAKYLILQPTTQPWLALRHLASELAATSGPYLEKLRASVRLRFCHATTIGGIERQFTKRRLARSLEGATR